MKELKPKPVASHKCRLILVITETIGKRVTQTPYSVRPVRSEFPEHRRAYQVRKLTDERVYHCTQDASGARDCDCPARQLGGRSCRHLRALAALGLLLSPKELAALNRREQPR